MSRGEKQILISRNGEQFGPYPESLAIQHMANGQLSPQDMAWHEGLADWIELRLILENPSETPPPPPPPDAELLQVVQPVLSQVPILPGITPELLEKFETQIDVLEKKIIGKMPREEIVQEWSSRGWDAEEVGRIHDFVEATRVPPLLEQIGEAKCSDSMTYGILATIGLVVLLMILAVSYSGAEAMHENDASVGRSFRGILKYIFCPAILFVLHAFDNWSEWHTGQSMKEEAQLIRQKYFNG